EGHFARLFGNAQVGASDHTGLPFMLPIEVALCDREEVVERGWIANRGRVVVASNGYPHTKLVAGVVLPGTFDAPLRKTEVAVVVVIQPVVGSTPTKAVVASALKQA